MTNARAAIFSRLRQSLGRDSLTSTIRDELVLKLQFPPVSLQPTINRDKLSQFKQQLEKVSGIIIEVNHENQITDALKTWLLAQNYPLAAVIDARLGKLAWSEEWDVCIRNAQDSDVVSVTLAFTGIAETGSVVMLSSADAPTPLNFLPDVHCVILYESDMVCYMEEAWQKLRKEYTNPPRTVNVITGPSRTADIEQTIQLGAHGPRQFVVILVQQR
ncbi:LutC/YkgG family protein [Thioflexithrix psekupsensis]|uniref:LUD domain-containing protein n=1 Tax=Thioflexithrix psekupsensis TaxID=1570016 RepID=A0A251XAI1_9GAMM|nr:lactate utilization protein C [Thioflexithrix psekupsensis]OUD14532.1 hypothetical protein TPSD3_09575 [Thioflexithrix psekupsensis]